MKRILPSVIAAGLLAAVPAQAQSPKNPYTPREVCGSSFRVIDSHKISDPYETMGRTYLLYSSATGENCAVTIKRDIVGAPTWTSVALQRQGRKRKMDSGNFSYYAGPLKVKARDVCVLWGGGMRVGVHSAGFLTDYEHCG